MSKIFKRNQLIITALAALVAVAGYINFGGISNGDALVNTNGNTQETGNTDENSKDVVNTSDISDQDILAEAGEKGDNVTDINSTDADINEAPGEAVLVNATGSADYIVESRLEKESLRAELMQNLAGIIENNELTSDEKKAAVDKYTALTTNAEQELLAETEIRGRGYNNVVVTKIDNKVDVVILSEPLEITEITRIEDIVKSKMGVEAENITITVMDTSK
ncbi:MAG: SpoIIIAH-like family protein [Lachnospiraceae bacterium]|nr:SpoIIIAH-like family protein [Lachnospiraceae bacterium]